MAAAVNLFLEGGSLTHTLKTPELEDTLLIDAFA